MKVGVLGTGDVGQALGRGFIALGHDAMLGGRDAANPKSRAWAQSQGARASTGTFAETARFGELVVLAVLGTAMDEVLRAAGAETMRGKVVIDTTNPLDFSQGMPPRLFVGHTDSLGERVQRALPQARVVKAFNIVGNAHMFRPEFPGGPPDMLIGGNDEDAKRQVGTVLRDFGWNVIDLGGIEVSRALEPMCIVWVLYGARTGSWNHAFKLLKK
jgi:predicted dinucleotide-binding enzyme